METIGRLSGSTRIIFYPSSFSRPQHAYGFSEKGALVVVYKVGGPPSAIVDTAFHELLHPLLRDCWNDARLNPLVAALAQQPLARTEAKPLLGVPSLYYARGVDATGERFEAEDYAALRRTWAAWRGSR